MHMDLILYYNIAEQ